MQSLTQGMIFHASNKHGISKHHVLTPPWKCKSLDARVHSRLHRRVRWRVHVVELLKQWPFRAHDIDGAMAALGAKSRKSLGVWRERQQKPESNMQRSEIELRGK